MRGKQTEIKRKRKALTSAEFQKVVGMVFALDFVHDEHIYEQGVFNGENVDSWKTGVDLPMDAFRNDVASLLVSVAIYCADNSGRKGTPFGDLTEVLKNLK